MTDKELLKGLDEEDLRKIESNKLDTLDKVLYDKGKTMENKTPAGILTESAQLYIEKEKEYGDNWKRVGPILSLLFKYYTPVLLKEWDKVHLITMIIVKLTRIVNSMCTENTHKDSTRDLVVYAAMLDSLDQ